MVLPAVMNSVCAASVCEVHAKVCELCPAELRGVDAYHKRNGSTQKVFVRGFGTFAVWRRVTGQEGSRAWPHSFRTEPPRNRTSP